jgi:hypothetical protein
LIRSKGIFALGITISLIFVAVGCIWLSSSTETLDIVAEHFGASQSPIWSPPMPDYQILGLEGNTIVNIVVGSISTLITLGVVLAVAKCLRLSKRV